MRVANFRSQPSAPPRYDVREADDDYFYDLRRSYETDRAWLDRTTQIVLRVDGRGYDVVDWTRPMRGGRLHRIAERLSHAEALRVADE